MATGASGQPQVPTLAKIIIEFADNYPDGLLAGEVYLKGGKNLHFIWIFPGPLAFINGENIKLKERIMKCRWAAALFLL